MTIHPQEPILFIEGEVPRPYALTYTDLCQLPGEYQVDDISTLMPQVRGKAVRLQGVLGMPPDPSLIPGFLTFHSGDGQYAVTLGSVEALKAGLLVYSVDGAPLPLEKGGPLRLFVPGQDDACAHIKEVSRIEVRHSAGKDTRPR